ncbi:transporter substrate-binding domain-containing protein [Saccharopolyspora gloriosae]|uniref:transporter substrate-binding domain-containing protein n=1 Tax=Saccharopolyspora gloriosae TaxID=455344 RepID=UPI001FB56F80|nr:transporter substrate-binding domain-containing protein [Saccharopolyspora gloriosae]
MRSGVVAVVLTSAMALAGCSGGGEPEQPPSAAPPPVAPPTSVAPPPPVELDSSPTLEQIRRRGSLLVGLRADAPEFAARDGVGGYRGFDVEVAKLVAQKLGLDPETQVSFRLLPKTLTADALAGGSVDLQVGGLDPAAPGVAAVGPYAVTDEATEHFLAIKSGDDAMRDQLAEALSAVVQDGSWQRAYDDTLAPAGVQARPAPR